MEGGEFGGALLWQKSVAREIVTQYLPHLLRVKLNLLNNLD